MDLGPPTVPVYQVVKELQQALANQIRLQMLHSNLEFDGQRLSELVATKAIYDRGLYAKLMNLLTASVSVVDEIQLLLASLDKRQINVLLMRYGFDRQTLESVGTALDVTRERIRQIEQQIKLRLQKSIQTISFTRICSAVLFSDDPSMSFNAWSSSMLRSGLLGHWIDERLIEFDPIELMIAICRITNIFDIPESLKYMIELHQDGKSSTPARALYLQKSLSKGAKRIIWKHLHHSGAVSMEWLADNEAITHTENELHEILGLLEYVEIGLGWYIPYKYMPDSKNKKQVFHRSLYKLFQYCGPVETRDVYCAVEHTLVRTDFPVPPTNVLETILKDTGYSYEDDRWYWDGNTAEELNRGEEIVLQTLREHNGVAHHAELMTAIVDSTLSVATLHATLKRSPLFDRFQPGLYKLRGTQPDFTTIERARSASERIPVNLEVKFDTYGNISVFATLSLMTFATGVIVSERLPNLTGEWKLREEESLLRVTGNEIRGLLPLLADLDCEVGDRIQLSFNTWERQVSARGVGVRS